MPEQDRTGGEVFGEVLFVGTAGLLKAWGPVRCYSRIIMDSARSWFKKFQGRGDKQKPDLMKKKEALSSKDAQKPPLSDETPSNATKQKVAAAKQYIENHYKSQMKSLQERKERYLLFANWFSGYDLIEDSMILPYPDFLVLISYFLSWKCF